MSQKLLSSLMRTSDIETWYYFTQGVHKFRKWILHNVAKYPYGQIQTNIYCPDKGGFTFSNMFDIQICKDKLNFRANYQRNGDLILNLYKNVARLREVSGTWRSGCWRFDCICIYICLYVQSWLKKLDGFQMWFLAYRESFWQTPTSLGFHSKFLTPRQVMTSLSHFENPENSLNCA